MRPQADAGPPQVRAAPLSALGLGPERLRRGILIQQAGIVPAGPMRVDAFSPGAQERTIAGVEPSSRADCGSVAKGPLVSRV